MEPYHAICPLSKRDVEPKKPPLLSGVVKTRTSKAGAATITKFFHTPYTDSLKKKSGSKERKIAKNNTENNIAFVQTTSRLMTAPLPCKNIPNKSIYFHKIRSIPDTTKQVVERKNIFV